MRRKHLTAALVLLVCGVWYGYQTSQLPTRTLPHAPPPAFFPWLLTCLLLLLALALLVQGLRDTTQGVWLAEDALVLVRPAAGLVLFIVYVAVLPSLGFVLASVPFCVSCMVLTGERRPGWVLGASLGIPLGLFVVFHYVFRITLPRGVLLG